MWFVGLLLFGCTSRTEEPAAAPVLASPGPVAWAWREGQSVRVPVGSDGRKIVTALGVVPVGTVEVCGADLRAEWPVAEPPVVVVSGEAPFHAFPKPPAVQAAVVERIAWRMAEFLGPRQGLVAGGPAEKDPAKDQGVVVRSVRKTRRNGPPVLVAVGSRDRDLVVLIADRDGETVLATARAEWPGPDVKPSALPVVDLDGDGTQELIVYADGPEARRLWYTVRLEGKPSLTMVDAASGPKQPCEP
jgi:hypothetical protein